MTDLASHIRRIRRLIPRAMIEERGRAFRSIGTFHKTSGQSSDGVCQKLDLIENRLRRSVARKDRRAANVPKPARFPNLPITERRDEIVAAIQSHPVVIIAGETGSGKTTQIPKFCLEAGRGIYGMIGCTQPRRIAAITVANRIAEELGEPPGRSVGYKIRFQDRVGSDAYIKVMTDGILLAETRSDPFLSAYDALIVDEAHERSLNIDFILGILKNLLTRRRDLKLIITSATIDTEKFSKAFGDAPVIEASGRMHPVEARYLDDADIKKAEADNETHIDLAVTAVDRVLRENARGDILVFMPTEQDIRDACEAVEGRKHKGVHVLPLFARLPARMQARIFNPVAGRKVIVATNIAETSLTIPGIRFVIDTGLARISRYEPRSRTTALPVEPVSRSSADQRMGRCGRVEDGVCIRLYTQTDYAARPRFTPPEILRANLAEVILRMIALKLGDIDGFPFIDPPAPKNIRDGFDLLAELHAIREAPPDERNSHPGRYRLTEKGRIMARLPMDPRIARILIEARTHECLREVLVIAAALCIQDPRERPVEAAAEADRAHAVFADPASDFLTLLNIWRHYHAARRDAKTGGALKKFCRRQFLSFIRMREWADVHHEIKTILEELDFTDPSMHRSSPSRSSIKPGDPFYRAVHKSVLAGFLSGIAMKTEKNLFRAARGREAMLFPGSVLFNRAPEWIVAAEFVETNRLYARTAAAIESLWIEEAGGDLCRRTYLNPRWDAGKRRAAVDERISLFGLIVIPRRTTALGPIQPDEATTVFIREALVKDRLAPPRAFQLHNREHIRAVADMEHRIRRQDILVDEDERCRFYAERLDGAHVFDADTLDRLVREKGGDVFLRMRPEDIMLYHPDEDVLTCFPERITIAETTFECRYAFNPGMTDDGVTVRIPAVQAEAVPPHALDWGVPGFLEEKIALLIKNLPKQYRKQLAPVADTVRAVLRSLSAEDRRKPLAAVLSERIERITRVRVPASAWSRDNLPDYLRARIAVVDSSGKELAASRNPSILTASRTGPADPDAYETARRKWENNKMTEWSIGDLPDRIEQPDKTGLAHIFFPALTQEGDNVHLKLFRRGDQALETHRRGVGALCEILLAKELKRIRRNLKLAGAAAEGAHFLGGAAQVEKCMYERLTRDCLCRDIRTASAFEAHLAGVPAELARTGARLREMTEAVIIAFRKARAAIARLHAGLSRTAAGVLNPDALGDELDRLIPENFLLQYDARRLPDIVRYLRAMTVRADRAEVNPEKDRRKAARILPLQDRLNALRNECAETWSMEKRDATDEALWMLEEFKVSVFAQELGAKIPVSARRIEKKLEEIDRME